jgi:ketosteroid isomerase-like protein
MSVDTSIVNRLFGAVDRRDLTAYLDCFTEDAEYKAGNYPPVFGHAGIQEFGAAMIPLFDKVLHNVENTWRSGDTVVCELELTYYRKDGKVVKIPCVDLIRLKDEKVKSLRAYLDATPAFV